MKVITNGEPAWHLQRPGEGTCLCLEPEPAGMVLLGFQLRFVLNFFIYVTFVLSSHCRSFILFNMGRYVVSFLAVQYFFLCSNISHTYQRVLRAI